MRKIGRLLASLGMVALATILFDGIFFAAALRKIFTDKLSAHDGCTVHSFLSNPAIATERLDDRLGSIKTPTLVIWGKQDKLVPLSSGERYAAGIAGAKLVTFEKCGHVPPVEKTEEFVGTVTAFLGRATAVPAH